MDRFSFQSCAPASSAKFESDHPDGDQHAEAQPDTKCSCYQRPDVVHIELIKLENWGALPQSKQKTVALAYE
jgi:hypothetical protein